MQELQVPGFLAAGVHAGLKSDQKLDVGLVVSKAPCSVAAVFTKNRLASACVELCRALAKKGHGRALLVNSGNANALVGGQAMASIEMLVQNISEKLGMAPEEILQASTGIIGVPLPIERMLPVLPELVRKLNSDGLKDVASAMITTDKSEKVAFEEFEIEGKRVHLAVLTKGAGMIAPNLATMLTFAFSDVAVEPGTLQNILEVAVEPTFNSIRVDGETSPNDMVLLFANGVSGVKIKEGPQNASSERFIASLKGLFEQNARKILEDGEGARHVVAYRVRGLEDSRQAKKLCQFLCDSLLVRCALAGEDPNFAGRLLTRIGSFEGSLPSDSLRVFFEGIPLYAKGELFVQKNREKISEALKKPFYEVHVDFGGISHEDVVCMGCDLTLDYVRFNSAYAT